MSIRHSSIALLCFALAGCSAIEIDSNPQPPRIYVPVQPVPTPAAVPTAKKSAPPKAAHLTVAELTSTTGTLRLTVEGAIILALDNNRSLKVDQFNPAIRKTFEAEQRAVFDPTLTGSYQYTSDRAVRTATVPGAARVTPVQPPPIVRAASAMKIPKPPQEFGSHEVRTTATTRSATANVGLTETLPTGTTVNLSFLPTETSAGSPKVDVFSSDYGLSVTQRLLRGAGLDVNLASLRQAKLDTLSSEYELRGFSLSLVAQVEEAYWNFLFAQRQIGIFEDGLAVAEKQLRETVERIQFGKTAASERYAAESEVAQRREALINARSTLETSRLTLMRLLSPSGEPFQLRNLSLQSQPVLPKDVLDPVEDHIGLALRARPDLNQARLGVKHDDLEIVKTKNGVLPDLDLFINLGRTNFANSFNNSLDASDNHTDTMAVGATFSYALGNRAARAQHSRAMLTREQGLEAVDNLAQLVELDVRDAYTEVNRLREQVAATATTRRLQEITLQVEQEKFQVGRSTSLLVAQAERDLLSAQVNELQAFVSYLNSIVELYRLDASLLERRGVVCPGRDPVELPRG